MRLCGGCKKEKPITEFYKHKRDGYQARCKECKRVSDRERNKKRSAYNKEKYKLWMASKGKQYYSRKGVRAAKAKAMRRYRKNPILRMKMEARWQVNRAIKSGGLKKMPCSVCSNTKSQAHHTDYYKPLEVVWLCRRCHDAEHAKAEGRA